MMIIKKGKSSCLESDWFFFQTDLHSSAFVNCFQAGNEVTYLTVTDVFIRLDANVGRSISESKCLHSPEKNKNTNIKRFYTKIFRLSYSPCKKTVPQFFWISLILFLCKNACAINSENSHAEKLL